MLSRCIRGFGLLAVVFPLLGGCGARDDLAGTGGIDPIMWESCGEVDCATISVPIDRFVPKFGSSARINLRVYRQVSPLVDSRHIPLIIHPGGPGTDVQAAVAGARGILAPLVEDFDIYALSTRGTVDGTAFDCGASLSDLRVIDVDSDAAARFADGCVGKSGDLVGRVGTRQSVEDLEHFRIALGFDSVRYLGWSYGATLGAAWAMTHPLSIRSMVLDAPSDPRGPWAEELSLRYATAADAFARSTVSTSLDGVGNIRERALAREFVLYEPSASGSSDELVALRLGETPNGGNDGGIETQIGVHCSDVTHAEARAALALFEPTPRIGFGASFDRVCLKLSESRHPLSGIRVDRAATRLDALVVSSTGDHVIPSAVSQKMANDLLWRSVVVDADRHLSVGFDPAVTKKAMAFLATGE